MALSSVGTEIANPSSLPSRCDDPNDRGDDQYEPEDDDAAEAGPDAAADEVVRVLDALAVFSDPVHRVGDDHANDQGGADARQARG